MKTKLFLALVVVIGSLLSGCAVTVKTLYDHEADFKSYKTFCWMDGCEFEISGPEFLQDSVLRSRIKVAIINELNKKGITQDNNNPDLLVGFNITVKDEKAIIYHRSPDAPFYSPFANDRDVVTYLKGTLVLGMADRAKSKIVWESFAVSYIDLEPDISKDEVVRGIRLVLKKFPPKP